MFAKSSSENDWDCYLTCDDSENFTKISDSKDVTLDTKIR